MAAGNGGHDAEGAARRGAGRFWPLLLVLAALALAYALGLHRQLSFEALARQHASLGEAVAARPLLSPLAYVAAYAAAAALSLPGAPRPTRPAARPSSRWFAAAAADYGHCDVTTTSPRAWAGDTGCLLGWPAQRGPLYFFCSFCFLFLFSKTFVTFQIHLQINSNQFLQICKNQNLHFKYFGTFPKLFRILKNFK